MCGIRLTTGGKNSTISNVTIHPGWYEGLSWYEERVNHSYGIHTKGGVVIDGVDWIVEGSARIKESFAIIDYQGYAEIDRDKKYYPVRVKNISLKEVYNNAKILKGGAYTVGTPEADKEYEIIEPEERCLYFPAGCVIFKNCFNQHKSCKDMIRNYFNVTYGLDRAWGFYFEDREIIGNGVAMAKTVKRRFNSYFSMEDHGAGINMYTFEDIPENKRSYNGVTVAGNVPKMYDSAIHFKGTITIENLKNSDGQGGVLDMDLGLVGREKSGRLEMVKKLISFNSSSGTLDKYIVINVDEFIAFSELTEVCFGYEASYAQDVGYLTDFGTRKVTYNVEVEQCNPEWIDWESNSKSYYSIR